MKFHVETQRLLMREFREEDAHGLLKLNSNLEVIKFLHMNPMKNIEEALKEVEGVINQYHKNKIGRWIVIEKSTNQFIGCSGLKLEDMEMNGHKNFFDVGYRFLPEFWGKGYATESAIASIKYGFEEMKLNKINAAAHHENIGSRKVLQKSGMREIDTFHIFDFQAIWFEITQEDYFSTK